MAPEREVAMSTSVLQGRLVVADRVVPLGQVVIDGESIVEVIEGSAPYRPTDVPRDGIIVPGFIDVHVHGIAGADVMDGSAESIARMARAFGSHGVTGFLASTVTGDLGQTRAALGSTLAVMRSPVEGAAVLGIHLEGPFLNPRFKGMQHEEYLLTPDAAILSELLDAGGGAARRVSLAPELPGADALIDLAVQRGIAVSIAHTGATYDQALAAMRRGARHVTHCFNAMTGIHHREPGVAGAALTEADLYAELIADGVHIHPAVMRLLIAAKGPNRVMLVTDSMSAADMPDGVYEFGGHEVRVTDGVARMPDGNLASSTLTMDAAVRNVIALCGVSLADALLMASSTPAEAIGLGDRKGRLAAGYDADIVMLDANLVPAGTWVGGRRVYTRA
jgi:N-acetylglucosamine-6-phosphate deacetylase